MGTTGVLRVFVGFLPLVESWATGVAVSRAFSNGDDATMELDKSAVSLVSSGLDFAGD